VIYDIFTVVIILYKHKAIAEAVIISPNGLTRTPHNWNLQFLKFLNFKLLVDFEITQEKN
jgi:hypothetical protein